MKKLEKVLAFLLAVITVVYGIPLRSVSAELEPEPVVESGTRTPAMRFVQHNGPDGDGFDESTGILTMDLEIRTSQPGTVQDSVPMEERYQGRFVESGYLAFRVDTASLRPITASGDEIWPRRGSLAYVGAAPDLDSPKTSPRLKTLFGPDGRVEHIGEKDLDLDLDLPYNNGIHPYYSGVLVSEERSTPSTIDPNNGMLDCYVQFRLSDSICYTDEDEDGFVKIMSLRFQCYSGHDASGEQTIATSDKMLFSKSIWVPEGVEVEVQGENGNYLTSTDEKELVKQFYVKKGDKSSDTMAMGAAGFREKKVIVKDSPFGKGYVDYATSSYYYFDSTPQNTGWSYSDWGTEEGETPPQELDGKPGLTYNNQDSHYLVEGFGGMFSNSYDAEDPKPADPDFFKPAGESSMIPRYQVPTLEEAERLEESVAALGGWVPESYADRPEQVKQVMLKYTLGTSVSENSELRPENDGPDGLDAFLRGIHWKFAFKDKTFLDDYAYTLTGDSEKVTTLTGTYTVEQAVISDETCKYKGKKLQVVTDDSTGESMVTPLGVMLEFHENTPVVYTNEEGEEVETEGWAPQLRISSKAADLDSYVWETSYGEARSVYLSPVYEDPSGGLFYSPIMQLKIYKDNPAATDIVMETEQDLTVTTPDGEQAEGFSVPVGGDPRNDLLVAEGIRMSFRIRDQYGFTALDKQGATIKPVLSVEPNQKTGEALAAKKGNPFVMQDKGLRRDTAETGWYEFALKYGEDMGTNDVINGIYGVAAKYTGVGSWEKDLTVLKENDYFAYMDTDCTGTIQEGEDGVRLVEVAVPERGANNEAQTRQTQVRLLELANQWRDSTDQWQVASEYDLVPGLRNENKNFDLNKVRAHFDVDFTYTNEAGEEGTIDGVNTQQISNGVFSCDSTTKDGTVMYLTVSVHYRNDPPETVKQNRYKFVFKRTASYLKRIVVTNAEAVEAGITVPGVDDEQGSNTGYLRVIGQARDQYDEYYSWERVYRDNPTVEGTWMVKMEDDLTGLDGITISGEFNHEITVDHTAQPVKTKLWVQFGGAKSQVLDFDIHKPASIPQRVTSFSYSKNTLTVPDKRDMSRVDTASPTIAVVDQFGEVMKRGEDYSVKWELAKEPTDKNKITINSETGVLSVAALSLEDPSITVLAKIYDKDRVWQWTEEYPGVKVVRNPATVADIAMSPISPDGTGEAEQFSINYPDQTSESTGRQFKFKATGSTQYGASEELKEGEVDWTLEKLVLQNGTELKLGIGSTGGIIYNSTTDTYTDKFNTLVLTRGGQLTLYTVPDRNAAPKSITITCATGGLDDEGNPIEERREIAINLGTSKVNNVAIDEAVSSEVIDVPSQGDISERKLSATVRDQFDFIMSGVSIKWSIVEGNVKGVKLDAQTSKILVDHTAESGVIKVRAVYEDPAQQKPLMDEVEVYISRAKGTPARVEIVGVKIDGKQQEELTVPLPGLKPNDYKTYQPATYQLVGRIYDNFDVPMSGVPMEWSVEGDTYGLVKDVVPNSGRVTVACTDSWKDWNQDTTVTVKMGLKNYPDVPVDTAELSIIRQEDAPAYAVPELVDYDHSDRPGYEAYMLVPQKGANPSAAHYTAKVYSQYGTVMAPGENTRAKLELVNVGPGLNYTSDLENSSLELKVSSTTSALYADVRAVPEKNQSGIHASSTKRVFFDLGVSYIWGSSLGSTPDSGNDNPTGGDVGGWKVKREDNVPVVDTSVKDTYTFKAFVADQRGAEYINTSLYYPIWQFAEDYPGVSFVGGDEEDGGVRGKTVTIEVTNEALAKDELSKTIYLDCWVLGRKEMGGENVQRQAFTMEKSPSSPKFLFFDDIDTDGVSTKPLQRPSFVEGSTTSSFRAAVYDQYGYERDDEVVLSLSEGALASQGAELEPVYANGVNPEEPGNAQPVSFNILQDEQKVAEFDPATGNVKLYTACKLTELVMFARSSRIPDLVKTMRIPIQSGVKKATTLSLGRENTGDIVIEDTGEEASTLAESIYAIVQDQFNEAYPGRDAYPVWKLQMKDEDGNYVDYQDMEEDGAVKPSHRWMVNIRPGESRNVVLTVNPREYTKPVTVRLVCELRFGTSTGLPLEGVNIGTLDLQIRKAVNGGSGGGDVTGPFTVKYSAGEHGELTDVVQEIVVAGGHPKLKPGVKAELGYGVSGWVTDIGEELESPADAEIWGDTTITAVYNDIQKYAFLNGYDDGTVRPHNAVTRGEFVKMLVIAINNYDAQKDYSHPFRDVDPKRYYDNYIGYAFGLGIISGDGKGNFRPDQPITRAEAAKMVAEAAKLDEGDGTAVFHDVKAFSWYAGYVQALTEAGILSGYEDGTFRPGKTLSREEAVKLLVLIMREAPSELELERIRKYGACPFRDVKKESWSYPYILRASGAA